MGNEEQESCCQKLARTLTEQFEQKMEERVRTAEQGAKEYLDKLKECIVLRDGKLLATPSMLDDRD